MRELSLQYLAGFFDGEGHVSILKTRINDSTRVRHWLRVGVCNTYPDVIMEFKRLFGGSVHIRKRLSIKHSPSVEWIAQYNIAERFLKTMMPYLVVKKRDAEIALNFQCLLRRDKDNGWKRLGLTDAELESREMLRQEMIAKHGLASRAYQSESMQGGHS